MLSEIVNGAPATTLLPIDEAVNGERAEIERRIAEKIYMALFEGNNYAGKFYSTPLPIFNGQIILCDSGQIHFYKERIVYVGARAIDFGIEQAGKESLIRFTAYPEDKYIRSLIKGNLPALYYNIISERTYLRKESSKVANKRRLIPRAANQTVRPKKSQRQKEISEEHLPKITPPVNSFPKIYVPTKEEAEEYQRISERLRRAGKLQ